MQNSIVLVSDTFCSIQIGIALDGTLIIFQQSEDETESSIHLIEKNDILMYFTQMKRCLSPTTGIGHVVYDDFETASSGGFLIDSFVFKDSMLFQISPDENESLLAIELYACFTDSKNDTIPIDSYQFRQLGILLATAILIDLKQFQELPTSLMGCLFQLINIPEKRDIWEPTNLEDDDRYEGF